MKRISCLIALLVILYSCHQNGRNDSSPTLKKENRSNGLPVIIPKQPLLSTDSIRGYIGKDLFDFKISADESTIKSIQVFQRDELLQTITVDQFTEDNRVELIDWNFDGYKDISILSNCGSGGCSYFIWNYSPVQKIFIYNTELSEELGLERYQQAKEIVLHYREGWQNESWDTFKYVNDKLVLVKGVLIEQWQDDKGKTHRKKTYHTK